LVIELVVLFVIGLIQDASNGKKRNLIEFLKEYRNQIPIVKIENIIKRWD